VHVTVPPFPCPTTPTRHVPCFNRHVVHVLKMSLSARGFRRLTRVRHRSTQRPRIHQLIHPRRPRRSPNDRITSQPQNSIQGNTGLCGEFTRGQQCAGGSIFVLYRDGSLISIGCVSFGSVRMDGSRMVKVEEWYFTCPPR